MSKKKILIISYSYPPANVPAAQRPYALAKYLDKDKYNVTVLTCSNPDSSLGFDTTRNEHIDQVKLIKVKSYIGSQASFLRTGLMSSEKKSISSSIKSRLFKLFSSMVTPDKAIFWIPKVKKFFKKNSEKYDIIISTSPFFSNHIAARIAKRYNPNSKWIVDIRDFHYAENASFYGNLFKRHLNKHLEESIIKKADMVTFISSAMKDLYSNYYLEIKDKFEVIYNGFDKEEFEHFEFGKMPDNKVVIFYAGSFYRGIRSPFPLFELLDKALELGDLCLDNLEVQIAGNLEEDIFIELKKYKSSACLKLLGRIPRSEVLKRLTKSQVLWLIVSNKITHYTGVPIKFYEYLAARRPILNFAPDASEPTKIIKENNLGLSINTSDFDIEKSYTVFNDFITSISNHLYENPLSEKSLQLFSRENQSQLFEEIIDNV